MKKVILSIIFVLSTFILCSDVLAETKTFDTGTLSSGLVVLPNRNTDQVYGFTFLSSSSTSLSLLSSIKIYDYRNTAPPLYSNENTGDLTHYGRLYLRNTATSSDICTSSIVESNMVRREANYLHNFKFTDCSIQPNQSYYIYYWWTSGTTNWYGLQRTPGTDLIANTAMYKNHILFGTNDVAFQVWQDEPIQSISKIQTKKKQLPFPIYILISMLSLLLIYIIFKLRKK